MSLETIDRDISGIRHSDIPRVPFSEIKLVADVTASIHDAVKISPEEYDKMVKELDILIDITPVGIIAGGLAVSVYGALRRNPTVFQRGLGIAAGGLILLSVDNPAQVVVEREMAYREDANGN